MSTLVASDLSASALQRELGLKDLQINRLLGITQAINENKPSRELFDMYASFLNWDLGIKRMALYFNWDGQWRCSSHIGLTKEEQAYRVDEAFNRYTTRGSLNETEHPLLKTFDFVIPVRHKDQRLVYVFLGDLTDAPELSARVQLVTTITHVVAVAIENKRLFKQELQQERYKTELALASDIQRSLVPTELPHAEQFEMAALYVPRFGVGGDFYSAELFEDGRLLFCVADISGKGTGAALLMSNFEASFWSLGRSRNTLAGFVHALNSALFRVTRGDRFLTLFLGEYDSNTRQLSYVNAGHNPPLYLNVNKEARELSTGCTFLGAFERIPRVDTGRLDLSEGGLLLCYTDGITELANPQGEMFGEERLAEIAQERCDLDALSFNTELEAVLREYQGDAEPTDDVTVLSVRFAAS